VVRTGGEMVKHTGNRQQKKDMFHWEHVKIEGKM